MTRRKKRTEEHIDLPEFGVQFVDEDDVLFTLESNHGKDMHKYLEHAKKLKRPILIGIESDIFDKKYKNFALTVDEARLLVKEITRMLDYLEE